MVVSLNLPNFSYNFFFTNVCFSFWIVDFNFFSIRFFSLLDFYLDILCHFLTLFLYLFRSVFCGWQFFLKKVNMYYHFIQLFPQIVTKLNFSSNLCSPDWCLCIRVVIFDMVSSWFLVTLITDSLIFCFLCFK